MSAATPVIEVDDSSSDKESESSNEEEESEESEETSEYEDESGSEGEESSSGSAMEQESSSEDIAEEDNSKKPTNKKSNTSCLSKIFEAIVQSIGSGSDVTRPRIYKYIGNNYPGTRMAAVRRALAKAVEDGVLAYGRTTQRFKMTTAGRAKAGIASAPEVKPPPVKKKKKKPVEAAKPVKKTKKPVETAKPPVKKKMKPTVAPPVKKKKPQKHNSGGDGFESWLDGLDSVEPYVEPPNDSDDELVVQPKKKKTKQPVKKSTTKKRKKPTITDYEPPKKKRRTKKTAKTKKAAPEKRLKRKRTCTPAIRQRISRALSQRLFMANWEEKGPHKRVYKVLGSTGNLYTIEIGNLVTCSCPDFRRGNHCKHCLFVMLKVLRVNRQDEKLWQRALLTSELEEIFDAAPELNMLTGVRASAAAQRAVNKATGKDTGSEEEAKSKQKPLEGNECCICLEDFDAKADKDKVVWCKAQCGNNLHKHCFQMFAQSKSGSVSCPFCRAPWEVKGGKAGKAGSSREGYMNFSATSGQSQNRDTSTYNRWSGYGGGYNRRRYRRW